MTIGLALSGGGMRGIAHIGAIQALEEQGIVITHIAGSSVGAIIGALYSYGYNSKEMLEFFRVIQILDFKKYALNKPGFIDAEKFYDAFHNYLKVDDFSSLKKKLIITATNILNGELQTFDSGALIKPLLASAAFPGVFAPVQIDDSYYVDGGVLDNFPVEQIREKCDVVIGVYVNGFLPVSMDDLKHSHNVIERAFKFKTVKEDLKKFDDCDIIICPKELSIYGTFDKKYLDTIYKIGYDNTNRILSTIKLPISKNAHHKKMK